MNASYLALVTLTALGFSEPVADEPDVAIHPAAARTFPAKVQPVLMNLCANCHCRPDHASGFKLSRVSDGYGDAQATNRNLRAAAAFVRPDNPALSPLLVKASSPHGGSKDPPILGRGLPAFKNLEAWARFARLGDATAVKQAATLTPLPQPAAQPTASEPAKLPAQTPSEPAAAKPPAAKPNPDDPFDPAAFNHAARGK